MRAQSAVNELFTSALRHGAVSGHRGTCMYKYVLGGIVRVQVVPGLFRESFCGRFFFVKARTVT